MVRSMYAGVAGMKANQTRMDVIGNNIANANTYGFKSSRATFRDMYYQQIRGASGRQCYPRRYQSFDGWLRFPDRQH